MLCAGFGAISHYFMKYKVYYNSQLFASFDDDLHAVGLALEMHKVSNVGHDILVIEGSKIEDPNSVIVLSLWRK